MEINNYFNQLRQMFETDNGANQDTTVQDNNNSQTESNPDTESAEADWNGFTANVDNFINQVIPLKDFFQSFVNTNSSRTDENGKNALNLANKYLNEAVDIEQTLNKAKQTISESTANELQTLKNAMDEAKKAAEAEGVNLDDNKTDNQTEEVSKNNTEETDSPKEENKDDNSSSSETAENPEQGEDKSKQNTE